MEEKIYKQVGRNDKYPKEVRVWRRGEPVPEWLSDISKISGMDNISNLPILATVALNTGGYIILESGSSGNESLVTVRKENDYVCIGDDSRIFSLTPNQLRLLYGKEVR